MLLHIFRGASHTGDAKGLGVCTSSFCAFLRSTPIKVLYGAVHDIVFAFWASKAEQISGFFGHCLTIGANKGIGWLAALQLPTVFFSRWKAQCFLHCLFSNACRECRLVLRGQWSKWFSAEGGDKKLEMLRSMFSQLCQNLVGSCSKIEFGMEPLYPHFPPTFWFVQA